MEIKKVEYIVTLKPDFFMPKTTIRRQFCGSLENIIDDKFFFKLNGGGALVIIPYRDIEWMAPGEKLWEQGCRKEDILDKKLQVCYNNYRKYEKE